MFRATLNTSIFQKITQLVRILPPPPAWIVAKLGHAKPQRFGDSRDSKNDSIWGARREIQRRRRHAPSCMGATELQSNWPEMRKTLGKPLVLQRRGQEPNNLQIPWETSTTTPRATRNPTRAHCEDSHLT